MKRCFSPQPLAHQCFVLLLAKLWCQSAINRIFTSTNLSITDDLYVTLRIFCWITRAESRQCAGDHELAFACALIWFVSVVNPRMGVGVDAAASICEEGLSFGDISVNAWSTLLACPEGISPVDFFPFKPTSLNSVAELAFGKRSPPACTDSSVRSAAFGWRSGTRTAVTRAAETTAPTTSVASHPVSRLNLLITSFVSGKATECSRVFDAGACNALSPPSPDWITDSNLWKISLLRFCSALPKRFRQGTTRSFRRRDLTANWSHHCFISARWATTFA